MAFHIHKQSASIDVKKQMSDFEQHRKLLTMHGKYKNNKVWGGGVPGSVSYKQSPKKFELKQNLKLPPLNNKPIFNTDKQSVFSVAMSTGKFTTGQSDVSAPLFAGAGVTDVPNLSSRGFNPKHRRSETKPNTAS